MRKRNTNAQVTRKWEDEKLNTNCYATYCFSQTKSLQKKTASLNLQFKRHFTYGKSRWYKAGKELDTETGLYYYGARYLDPKTSRWLSGDPALGDYLPSAPVNDEARKRNGNLPGMGGVFNLVNLHVYHYAGNNPVKYVDPDGNDFQPKTKAALNRIERLGTGVRRIFDKNNTVHDLPDATYVGDKLVVDKVGGRYFQSPDSQREKNLKDESFENEDHTVYVQDMDYSYQDDSKPGRSQITKGTAYIVVDNKSGKTIYECHDVNNDGYIDYAVDDRYAQTRIYPENNPKD